MIFTWTNKKSGATGTCTKEQMDKMKADKAFRDRQGRCKLRFKQKISKTAIKPTATAPTK